MPFPTNPVPPSTRPAHERPATAPALGPTRAAVPRRSRRSRLARTVAVPLLLAALVTAGSPGWGIYRIRQGDTLSDIAARYHTTVSKLVQANRLPGNGNLIIAGHTLKVPSGSSSGGSGGRATVRHRVVSGDTLGEIAARYGVSAATVARANHLPSSNIVRLGATLVVPGARRSAARSSSNTFAGRTYASSVVSAASRHRAMLARRHLPSQSQMRALIVRKARANGVDPALALAVSWQESGWGMHHVSVADAVGAMQVIPSTGRWLSGVVGRPLNLLDPSDNVTAGVVLLRILTREGGERNGIAGYYQGLRSVRQNGMYADTKQYVRSVLYLKKRFG
jgi:LysM repeat protein